ncbi:MAG TPA: cache domain-containing protein, partial [Ktedonobacteraceae bacterium]
MSSALEPLTRSRRKISLTVRISALLIAAVVLPLLITIIGSELILRPTLTSQATAEMQNDAQAHAGNIDALLIARLQDLSALSQFYAIQQFLAGKTLYEQQARDELALGYHLDPNYNSWTLFDTKGNMLLSYLANPSPRGKYQVAPEILAQLKTANKTVISNVYFDGNLHMAFIDIYTSISSAKGTVLGIGRSTLMLNDIWTAVNSETNAATGSYAMIVDGNGVRIAYTNPDTTLTTEPPALFKAIAPLSQQFKQQISNEDLYGNSQVPVKTMADPALVNQQPATFQFTPTQQNQAFQAVEVHCTVVPWTYVVLRPVNTITGAANQQDIYLLVIAAIVTALAAVVGLTIGRQTTRPILRSVALLTANSESLKRLSTREQARAKEQKWIVESAQTGLKSVQYYAKASGIAAHKLDELGKDITQNWEHFDNVTFQRRLYEITSAANYLEKASSHQERSSKGLSTAIQVTNQVADQLV